MGLKEELTSIKTTISDGVVANKVSKFAYTDTAYNENDVNGVATYDVTKEQNIPLGTPSVMKVNETVVTKGWRARASSITRMLMNHFLGRISYNLNKANDVINSMLSNIISYLGTANGIATLDINGRIPYTQLPDSMVTLKGYWNASTNTPTLVDGTGTNGDEYIVDVAGSQDLGSGSQYFKVGDRVVYSSSIWRNIDSGSVKSVCNVTPDQAGNVSLAKGDVGLGNVANTGDSATPVSGGTTKFTTGGAYTELAKKVDKTTTVNGHALSSNVTVTKGDVGLGNVANTGDSATPVSGGTTKFTTGGAYNIVSAQGKVFSTSETYHVGDVVFYQGKWYTTLHERIAGAWNSSDFQEYNMFSSPLRVSMKNLNGFSYTDTNTTGFVFFIIGNTGDRECTFSINLSTTTPRRKFTGCVIGAGNRYINASELLVTLSSGASTLIYGYITTESAPPNLDFNLFGAPLLYNL